jgi:hypothetical protein
MNVSTTFVACRVQRGARPVDLLGICQPLEGLAMRSLPVELRPVLICTGLG